ncbi:MAG: hypothetical protein H6741_28430 [Alphaproteobacteria bacterium]|nr:hypothetical protein [Alphaproteobacteria bacterium]MCB9796644.1 hypothetical protein [Alphaproteobacteria bacterium]
MARRDELYGLRFLQKGRCFTAEQDKTLALGWPWMIVADEDLSPDLDVPEAAVRALAPLDPTPRRVWPKALAAALARAWGEPALYDMAPGVRELRQGALEAVWNAREFEPSELSSLLSRRLTSPLIGVSERTMAWYLPLLESLTSTRDVVTATLDRMEGLSEDTMRRSWSLPPRVSYALGVLLLRLPTVEAEVAMERMAAILRRVTPDHDGPLEALQLPRSENSHARALHLILHGASAAEACTDQSPEWYRFAGDDPDIVRMRVALCRQPWELDARLVALVGSDLIRWFDKAWPKLQSAPEQAWMVEQLAPFNDWRNVRLMLKMASGSLARTSAQRWLDTNAEAIRPILEDLVDATGTIAGQAQAQLERVEA